MQVAFPQVSTSNAMICVGDDGTFGGWCTWNTNTGAAKDPPVASGFARMNGTIWNDVLTTWSSTCTLSTTSANECIVALYNVFYNSQLTG